MSQWQGAPSLKSFKFQIIAVKGAFKCQSALTMLSAIFLASPRSIIVLSR